MLAAPNMPLFGFAESLGIGARRHIERTGRRDRATVISISAVIAQNNDKCASFAKGDTLGWTNRENAVCGLTG
jgi:hypothetical protein